MKKISLAAAFSLIELMISLVVISSITAAFAPVISKKLSSNATTISSGQGSISTKCEDKFGADCTLCYKTKCIVCTKSCPTNTYRDIPTCTCKSCSDKSAYCTKCNDEKCIQCNAGYKLVNGKCEKCQAGYSCNGITQTICSAGTYSGAGAASCTACQAGKYQPSAGKTSCNPCAAGTYQGSTGKTSCNLCSAGYYQPNTGKSSCTACPAGKYQASTGKSYCNTCAAGKYQGSTGKSYCDTCSAGKYSATGASSCTSCPAGQYQPNSGKSSCIVCPAGKYQPNTGQASCIACPIGQYQEYTGKTSCDPCGSGKTTLNTGSKSSSSCINCPSNCTNCEGTTCKECASGYVVQNGSTCVLAFPGKDFTSSTTWTVPAGLTKINVTLVGGGYKSGAGATITGTTKTYTSNDNISLTGNYAALKGKTITVKLCGAGGLNGTHPRYCSWCNKSSSNSDYNRYCSVNVGKGAAGGMGSGTMTISSSASSLSIIVGKVGGGSAGTAGKRYGSTSADCAKGDYAGKGGAGGGHSSVSDGITTITAGGGGGGSASASTKSSGDYKQGGGNGGDGGGGTYGGAGGTGRTKSEIGVGASNLKGRPGSPGSASVSDSYSRSGYCNAGQNGIVEVVIPSASITGSGGNSGKCWRKTGIAVTPGTKCTIHVGGSSGGESYIQCGSAKYSSNSGTRQHSASGATGGSGFSKDCNSGSYGAGGNGSTSTTPNPGKNGYIRIDNGIT